MSTTMIVVEPRATRRAGIALLAAGAAYAASPVHPPLPCPLRTLTGIPCPLCGMTRAVSAAMHGDMVASLRFNPFGLLLVIAAVVGVVLWPRRSKPIVLPLWTGAVLLAVMWLWNLTLNPTFH